MFTVLRHDRCVGPYVRAAVVFFAAVLCVGLSSQPALAHKVTIFAWVEGDTIYTQSKFSGGRRAKNATVVVYDKDGWQLLEGKTDQKGMFSFKVPKKTDLRVVLKASMGHQAEWHIPVEDLVSESEDTAPGTVSEPVHPQADTSVDARARVEVAHERAGAFLSPQDMERVINRVLDKKLEPIQRMLAESMDHGPTVSDVVGGLGYIIGLMGVAMIVTSRRPKDRIRD
ncbi:MAG: hypothetical protein JRI36_11380 [Deltaproteobacteria bacterium]|nr:hypothetical protein [Deltaproteobacteria bacterium]